jgi:SAM-dependent methyltransferase
MDPRAYNRAAWNHQVATGNIWTRPVGPEVIARARRGDWHIVLTENTPVPRAWFPPDLAGRDVLCLASGGGQQGPILAAAGARVTVYDNSPAQLAQDRLVAEREGLSIITLEGDMRDLAALPAAGFDLVVHPVSNIFVPAVRPVWNEAFRVMRPGGLLLAGLVNPAMYLFDFDAADRGEMLVRYTLPYADVDQLPPDRLQRYRQDNVPLEWSHSLTDLLGGQLDAGFVLTALYEDRHNDNLVGRYMPTYLATRALKLA